MAEKVFFNSHVLLTFNKFRSWFCAVVIVSNLLEKYLKQNVRMVDGIKIAYTLHTRTTQCNEQ